MATTSLVPASEIKKLAAIMVVMIGIAHVRREQIRKRWLGDEATQQQVHAVDHPAVPYLIENGVIIGCAVLAETLISRPDREQPMRELLKFYMRGTVLVEPGLLAQKLMCKYVYPHVPYFSKQKPPEDFFSIARDYFTCNFPASLVNIGLQLALLKALPADMYHKVRNPEPFNLMSFFKKMLVARIVVDATFGMVHKAMHDWPAFYKMVHARHHGHRTPRTQTNFHFEALDIFLEAIFPLYAAQIVLLGMGWNPSRVEQTLLFSTLIYYESASHSGKELPAVTWFPLLSPLVGWITGSDERLVEYHTRHHQLLQCNFSISPWWDKYVTNTYRIDLPKGYDVSKSYEGE